MRNEVPHLLLPPGDYAHAARGTASGAGARVAASLGECAQYYGLLAPLVGRCAEVIETAEHAIRLDPNRLRTYTGLYNELAVCKTRTGHAEEELALQAQADQLNPRSPWNSADIVTWGSLPYAGARPGSNRVSPAIACHEPGSPGLIHSGPIACWRQPMPEPARSTRRRAGCPRRAAFGPCTVRGIYPEELSSPVYAAADQSLSGRLRLAGLRDHADEDADFGFRQTDRCTAKMSATRR